MPFNYFVTMDTNSPQVDYDTMRTKAQYTDEEEVREEPRSYRSALSKKESDGFGGFSYLGGKTPQENTTELLYRYNGRNQNRDYIYNKLLELGLPTNVAEALTIHAGAESGYNFTALNRTTNAYGIGQWIGSTAKNMLLKFNAKYGTNYEAVKDMSMEDQVKALALHYWDNGINKNVEDASNKTVRELVSYFAKWGLGPALLSKNGFTWGGVHYGNTDQDALNWYNRHHPLAMDSTWGAHIDRRYKSAGHDNTTNN